jgi:hypothetical protein
MNDIARYEQRKQTLIGELEFALRTGYRVTQFADHGDFDITATHNQQLRDEIDECDLMIANEKSRAG